MNWPATAPTRSIGRPADRDQHDRDWHSPAARAAASARARSRPWAGLAGEWEFIEGDDAHYVDPAFDDSTRTAASGGFKAWGQNDDITVVAVQRRQA